MSLNYYTTISCIVKEKLNRKTLFLQKCVRITQVDNYGCWKIGDLGKARKLKCRLFRQKAIGEKRGNLYK